MTRFSFSPELSTKALEYLLDFKSMMDMKAIDFNSDLTKQYQHIRREIVSHDEAMVEHFGPLMYTMYEDDPNVVLSKEEKKERVELLTKEKKAIQGGYNRVLARIKKIRQQFSETVNKGGLSSGSAKVVLDNYELLMEIYGGSSSVEPLPYGVSSDMNLPDILTDDDDVSAPQMNAEEENGDGDDIGDSVDGYGEMVDGDGDVVGEEMTGGVATESSKKNAQHKSTGTQKRSLPIPRLIDDKRRKMEKTLSAAQRDKILMKDAKDDAQTRKDLVEVLKEGNTQFQALGTTISNSMSEIASAFTLLAQSLASSTAPHPPSTPPQYVPLQPRYHHPYHQETPRYRDNRSPSPINLFSNRSGENSGSGVPSSISPIPGSIQDSFMPVSPLVNAFTPYTDN